MLPLPCCPHLWLQGQQPSLCSFFKTRLPPPSLRSHSILCSTAPPAGHILHLETQWCLWVSCCLCVKGPSQMLGRVTSHAPGSRVLSSCLAMIPALSSMRQSPQVPKDPQTWDPVRVDPGAFSTTQVKSPFLLLAFTRKKWQLAQTNSPQRPAY